MKAATLALIFFVCCLLTKTFTQQCDPATIGCLKCDTTDTSKCVACDTVHNF